MIKINFNDRKLSVEEGTRVLELIDKQERKNLVVFCLHFKSGGLLQGAFFIFKGLEIKRFIK